MLLMRENDVMIRAQPPPPPFASNLKQKENPKMDVVRILFKDGEGKPGIFLKLMVKPFNFFYETCYNIQNGRTQFFKNNFYFL
jgi:hypothetical protein